MHIHILGIAGTFMASLAIIAKQLGHKVTGMDKNAYPPMSTQLDKQNISYTNNYDVKNLPCADIFIIGNALTRGNKCVEEILNKGYRYTSAAKWLSENVLYDKWVLAISGTHGKTTTSSMLAWILEYAGLNPSFLIGGIAKNFTSSSRLTNSKFFVIEADEYDSAFFDKRSKFVHYHPRTLVINNLEFDHGDIFDSITDIQKQFHYLIRTMAKNALIIHPDNNENIDAIFAKGLWSKTQTLPKPENKNEFIFDGKKVNWNLLGTHNIKNALSAIYAAKHIGVSTKISCAALEKFSGIKRRLEIKYQNNNITIYDDFAHHPSAIKATLSALRAKVKDKTIIAVLELRSNTMRMGLHQQTLKNSLKDANKVFILRPKNINWDIDSIFKKSLFDDVSKIINQVKNIKSGHIVIMSNGGFDNIHDKLIKTFKNN